MNGQEQNIESGSAEGLYEFCDWLVKKGLMTGSAVEPLRSATKQIVEAVDSDVDAASIKVGEAAFDVESYMDRFEKIAGSKYAPDSLNAYRRRFRRAVELYRQYLKDGPANVKAPEGRIIRKRPTRENGNGANTGAASQALASQTPAAPLTPPATPELIDYPFRSGRDRSPISTCRNASTRTTPSAWR